MKELLKIFLKDKLMIIPIRLFYKQMMEISLTVNLMPNQTV